MQIPIGIPSRTYTAGAGLRPPPPRLSSPNMRVTMTIVLHADKWRGVTAPGGAPIIAPQKDQRFEAEWGI